MKLAWFASLLLALPVSAQDAPKVDAARAFEKLKGLAGDWHMPAAPDAPPGVVRYEVVSGGTVVQEILFPGSAHEMRSMFHRDGQDLVMTHYCAMGNQPRMRLELHAATETELRFAFDGGTNFDPAKDLHVHSGFIRFEDPDTLKAEWAVYRGAQEAGKNAFDLTRAR